MFDSDLCGTRGRRRGDNIQPAIRAAISDRELCCTGRRGAGCLYLPTRFFERVPVVVLDGLRGIVRIKDRLPPYRRVGVLEARAGMDVPGAGIDGIVPGVLLGLALITIRRRATTTAGGQETEEKDTPTNCLLNPAHGILHRRATIEESHRCAGRAPGPPSFQPRFRLIIARLRLCI